MGVLVPLSAVVAGTLLRPGEAASLDSGHAISSADPARARALAEAESWIARTHALPVPDAPSVASDVNDPVFAYMVGLLDRDIYGGVRREHFDQVVEHCGRPSRIPHELIEAVWRAAGAHGNSGWVRATFSQKLDVPVPYSILGYHPGSLLSSHCVTFEEWRLGRTRVPNPLDPDRPNLVLEDLTLWGIVDGEITIDIDGWVDALMGGRLDDTYIVGLALFRYEGERLAMALGFNDNGEGRSGALDVMADEIRFPSPPELKLIGRTLRGWILSRLARRGIPAWAPPQQQEP